MYPNDERNVILQKLVLVVGGKTHSEIDLTQDVNEIKKKKFVIKQGLKCQIRIDFIVQREIVIGLKYIQKTSRLGVTIDKVTHMVGSYAPQATPYSYATPFGDVPMGVAWRGSYHVDSFFTDDDLNPYLKWDWTMEVKKDWSET